MILNSDAETNKEQHWTSIYNITNSLLNYIQKMSNQTSNESANHQEPRTFHGHRIVDTDQNAETTLSEVLRDFRRDRYTQIAIDSLQDIDVDFIQEYWEWSGVLQSIAERAMIAPLLSHGYLSEEMLTDIESDEYSAFDELIDKTSVDELRVKFSIVLHDVSFIFDIIESCDSVMSMHQGISNDMRLHHCAYSLVLSYDKKVDLGIDQDFIDRYEESTKWFGGDRVIELDVPE